MSKSETIRGNYTSLLENQFNELADFDVPGNDKSGCCRVCRKKMIHRRLPILSWITKYSTSDAIGDLKAALIVGLTVVPQSLAFSCIVGLPPEYGFYGTFVSCFVYTFLGSYKDSASGPNPVAALLVGQLGGGKWQQAVLMTFLTGLVEVVMGILQLGFLVELVSEPVNSGFTSAVALLISTGQLKRNVFDIQTPGRTLIEMWTRIFEDKNKIQMADTVLGLLCIAFLAVTRWLGSLSVGPKDEHLQSNYQKLVNKSLWFVGVTRNGVVVIMTASLAWYLEQTGKQCFSLIGYIPPGVPSFAFPAFSIPEISGNGTNGEEIIVQQEETFVDMVSYIGSGLFVVPLIALLDNTSVSKTIAEGKPVDTNQELMVSGIANICNSFFQGYRSNGGLARSALIKACGARTQMVNFIVGCMVILSLIYITPCLSYIPKPTLAALIIGFIMFTIQYEVIVPMWRSKRMDLIPGLAAFFATLFMPIELGLLVGVVINMIFFVYHSARPNVDLSALETSSGQPFLRLTPDRSLMFPSVEFIRNIINKSGKKTNLPVVIDCTYIFGGDFTAAKAVSVLVKDFKARHQKIVFYNLKPSVAQVFEGARSNLIVCYDKSQLEFELSNV